MCSNNVPVSHCKDTYYFDKTNNYFKKVKEKGDQVSDLLCPKLTELLYNECTNKPYLRQNAFRRFWYRHLQQCEVDSVTALLVVI